MAPAVCDGEYVFVASAAPLSAVVPTAMIREGAGFSYVLDAGAARAAGLRGDVAWSRIDLGIDTDLSGVGFLARITTTLALANIPVNPIAGTRRDHLFVPVERANDAKQALAELAARCRDILETLHFWFGEFDDGFASAAVRKRWFAADPAFDRVVTDRFAERLAAARTGALDAWRESPRGCLAFILITDQFSRQIHRGSAEAFATDALALKAARLGVERGFDRALAFDERVFFYLPFEHSEAGADQDASVALFEALNQVVPNQHRDYTGETLRFAKSHRDIIARYGRFPHRNAVLGRASTPEELAFLVDASRFGQ